MRLTYVVGARPNFVKMAPVIAELRQRLPEAIHEIVHTGQHYDREMSQVFLQELGVPEPDHLLGVGSGSHAVQTARVMERLEAILEHSRPNLVIVPGDVNSTLGAALVAAKLRLRLAHVESGLRSFDRSMPEEINRIVTDQLSDLLFVHSEEAIGNLRREGAADDAIHFVGNTMIDSLVAMEERFRNAGVAQRLGVKAGEYVLVTLHRPALVDGPMLFEALAQLEKVARELPVVFPVHPRTRQRLGDAVSSSRLLFTDPLGYVDFLSLEGDAGAVLTDSGGVQEETTYLGVPCFTLRDSTERPVTISSGTNLLLGLEPARISELVGALSPRAAPTSMPPLWDGRAAVRLGNVVTAYLGSESLLQMAGR